MFGISAERSRFRPNVRKFGRTLEFLTGRSEKWTWKVWLKIQKRASGILVDARLIFRIRIFIFRGQRSILKFANCLTVVRGTWKDLEAQGSAKGTTWVKTACLNGGAIGLRCEAQLCLQYDDKATKTEHTYDFANKQASCTASQLACACIVSSTYFINKVYILCRFLFKLTKIMIFQKMMGQNWLKFAHMAGL